MPSILRSAQQAMGVLLLVIVAAQASIASAAGEPIAPADITFEPASPSANESFSGVLHRQGHPGSLGFLEDASGFAEHRVTADTVDLLFDTGCGFLCQPLPDEVVASPFTLPGLPAGHYRVRVLSHFGENPDILADVDLVVGGVVPGATALPLGGGAAGTLLGALVVGAGLLMLRSRTRRLA